ncbi:MAG: tRNA (adenosine(37)-N6)-threonylcarbamoyltransferase complex ATPase subunit type 1 TsaE [Elusimicrobiota bacterium]|jgi:tRNA threonylcarbamoyladenosine biosynthesis protein TsaE|nr:tRNA (adenosine(37)-N6)-threonylcarbamoyltransferase complex ATPase subunit type 1 TsaE [Elusimicrobiota bacterium]
MKKLIFRSGSAEDTRALAHNTAAFLKGGEILFFRGPIGAGKTVMVGAIAEFFGFKRPPVSASFSLIKKYKNKNISIYHIDLFRLRREEMFNLGFEEMLSDENAVILAEWPDAAEEFFPRERLEIKISLQRGDLREIEFSARGAEFETLLANLARRQKRRK